MAQHISALSHRITRSDQPRTRVPWDDGALCLIDTLRVFRGGFLYRLWRCLCCCGYFVFVQASICIEVGVFLLECGSALTFAFLQGCRAGCRLGDPSGARVPRPCHWCTPRCSPWKGCDGFCSSFGSGVFCFARSNCFLSLYVQHA